MRKNFNLNAQKNNVLYKVYILANRDQSKIPKRTKIGLSMDPKSRLKSLKLDKIPYRGFDDLYIYGIYEINEPAALEAAAHIYFQNYRCKDIGRFDGYTEFFDISPELAHRFMIKAGARQIHKPEEDE